MSLRLRYLFLLFIGVLHGSKAQSKPKEDTVRFVAIHDLKSDWQVYDNRYKTYVPYITTEHARSNKVCFWLDPQYYKNYYLHIYSTEEMFLFANNRLVASVPALQWESLSIDSLSKHYSKKVFLTLYSKKHQSKLETIIGSALQKVSKVSTRIQKKERKRILPKRLAKDSYRDILVLMFWGVMLFLAVLVNTYPKTFSKYLKFRNLFGKMDDNPFVNKSFTSVNILFLLGYVFITTFVYWMVSIYYLPNNILWSSLLEQSPSQVYGLFQILIVLVLTIIVLLLKYVLTYLISFVFSMQKIFAYHYYEYIKVSWWFYSMLSIVMMYLIVGTYLHVDTIVDVFKYVLLVFFIGRAVYITIHLNSAGSFRNLYLISYLCASEIIPLVFYSKVVIFK